MQVFVRAKIRPDPCKRGLNLFLQKEEPLIGAMNQALKQFLRLLACQFIAPVTVKAAELLDPVNHLYGEEIFY